MSRHEEHMKMREHFSKAALAKGTFTSGTDQALVRAATQSVEFIAVSVIANGSFRNCFLPNNLVLDLVEKLRIEGPTQVHLTTETITVDGLLVLAKGANHSVMLLPRIVGGDAHDA
ncbi:hypothetical protein [Lysinibacillus sp. FSL W8-0953]|uniref:hypothetical protein n=1 Tax=Lysinibacillus sp. FSL W8-0953 TaxID=2954640 RepID=UPI0030FC085A